MSPHERIAAVLQDWADFERGHRDAAVARALATPELAGTVQPCEGCGKKLVTPGGLCEWCLDIAAGACRAAGRRR